MKKSIYSFFLLMALFSCSGPKELSPIDYYKWVEDFGNGLHKEHQIGDLLFDVQFEPTDFVICKSGLLNDLRSIQELDSIRKNYDSSVYITVTLKDVAGRDPLLHDINGDAQTALYYFQYKFQKDIYIISEDRKTKVFPVLFHFERFYTVNNCRVFLLAFDKKDIPMDKDISLSIDSDYLTSGMVQFYFSDKIIASQPKIKI